MIVKVARARSVAAASTSGTSGRAGGRAGGGTGGDGGGGAAPKRKSDQDFGRSFRNLISYLVGPGKANEHTDPTMVAGTEQLHGEFGDVVWADPQWQGSEVSALAKQLNRPMLRKRLNGELPEDRAWVMQVVISMEPGTTMTHEMWGQVAQEYVAEMGFDGSHGKAECRWVAFHHGMTGEGMDHLHLAISAIREDGTWISTHNSYRENQRVRRLLEQRHGFTPAEEAAGQRDRVPFNQVDAARNTHARTTTQTVGDEVGAGAGAGGGVGVSGGGRQLTITDNERLRRTMVRVLGASSSEAEYVRGLWSAGVLTRPRFAPGTTDVVVGYSVALRPGNDRQPIWHAAGKVHPSLKLGEVRGRFPDTVEAATAAAATWRRVDGARKTAAHSASDLADTAAIADTADAGGSVDPTAKAPDTAGAGAGPNKGPARTPRDPAAAARGLVEIRRRLDPPGAGGGAPLAHVIEVSRASAAAWAALAETFEPNRRGPYTAAAEATWRLGSHTLDGDQLVPAGRRANPGPDGVGRAVPARVPAHTGLARSIRLIAQASSSNHTQSWAAVLEQLVLTSSAIAEALRANNLAHEAAYLTAKTEAAAAELSGLHHTASHTTSLAVGGAGDPTRRDTAHGTATLPRPTVSPNPTKPEPRRPDPQEGGRGRPGLPPWRDPNRDPGHESDRGR